MIIEDNKHQSIENATLIGGDHIFNVYKSVLN